MSGVELESRFSRLLYETSDPSIDICDKRLLETKNFIAAPSKGSLVPGWVLVIPKKPSLSFSTLSRAELDEADELVREIAKAIQTQSSSITIFEHGARNYNSKSGCGVDHAHIHVVPLEFDLAEVVIEKHPEGWHALSHWTELSRYAAGSDDYLLVSNAQTGSHYRQVRSPTSQYFRKIIADEVGISAEWDYKKFSFEENALKTFKLFHNIQ